MRASDYRPGQILSSPSCGKARWEVLDPPIADGEVRTRLLYYSNGTTPEGLEKERICLYRAEAVTFSVARESPEIVAAQQLQDHADYYAAVTEGVGDV